MDKETPDLDPAATGEEPRVDEEGRSARLESLANRDFSALNEGTVEKLRAVRRGDRPSVDGEL